MKKLNYSLIEQLNGGGVISAFCTGVEAGGLVLGGLIRFGVIAAAGATGGGALAVIGAGCAIYSIGGGLKWW